MPPSQQRCHGDSGSLGQCLGGGEGRGGERRGGRGEEGRGEERREGKEREGEGRGGRGEERRGGKGRGEESKKLWESMVCLCEKQHGDASSNAQMARH